MKNMISPTIHLFVFDSMADGEAAFILAAIRNSQRAGAADHYRVVTAGATARAVTTIGGKLIRPDVVLDAVTPDSSAMLILPGGHAWDLGANTEALQLASRFIASGTPVAAISAGMLALTRAGLLNHLRLTGSTREYLISSGHRGTGFYCGNPIAASPAGVSPIDFAREIFKMLDLSATPSTEARFNLFQSGDGSTCSPLAAN